MNHSESINELAAALAQAQGAFEPAKRSATNPHLKNRYATLDDIIQAVRDPLAANGLSFMQLLDSDENGPALTTMLLHESGQWLQSRTPVDAMESNRGTNDMQAFGATLTYLKRYALAAMLGVSTDEDTDGNGAGASKHVTQRRNQPKRQGSPQTTGGNGAKRPYPAAKLREVIQAGIEDKRASDFSFPDGKAGNYRTATVGNLEMCFAGDQNSDQKRHLVSEYLTGKTSSQDWDDAEIKTLHKWLGARPDEDTGEWHPNPLAVSEAKAVARQALIESGQQEMAL
jgi:hypothetical protein